MENLKQIQKKSNLVLPNLLTKFLFLFVAGIQFLGITKTLSRLSIILVLIVALLYSSKTEKISIKYATKKMIEICKTLTEMWQSNLISKVQISLLATITASSTVIAIFAPPNNWDSMTYHIPRMEHWFQNGSMWFYETNNDRQLWMQSFNSHLFLIAKALNLPEFSYNFVQLVAFMLILMLTVQVLYSCNKPKKMILSTVLIVATIPNLIVQVPTTQSDVLAGLALLLNFIYLKQIIEGNQDRKTSILFGMSFAIATFSKGTLFAYLAVSGLYVLIASILKFKKRFPVATLSFVGFTMILNSFTWIQSIARFGSISGPQTTSERFVQSPISSGFTPRDIIASFIHFTTNNLQSYSHELNATIFEITYKIADFFRIDLLADSNSWPNWNPSDGTFTNIFQMSFGVNEDAAVSPILIFLLFAMCIFEYKLIVRKNYLLLSLNSVVLVYYFLTIIILRWNLFLDRYFIPVAILSIICIVMALSANKKNTRILISLSLIATIYSLPYVFRSEIRPLVGSESILLKNSVDEKRFIHKKNLLSDYVILRKTIERMKPSSLEISIGGDDWEFPIWNLAHQNNLKVYDYRNTDRLKGSNPLLICYVDCKLAPIRENTFVIMKPIPEYLTRGSVIRMNAGINRKVLIEGWGEMENWGIWTISNRSKMRFNVEPNFFEETNIHLDVRSLVITGTTRTMEIAVNNQYYKTYNLNDIGELKSIKIEANFLEQFKNDEAIELNFSFSNLISPKQAGFSSDNRLLGIGLISVTASPKYQQNIK